MALWNNWFKTYYSKTYSEIINNWSMRSIVPQYCPYQFVIWPIVWYDTDRIKSSTCVWYFILILEMVFIKWRYCCGWWKSCVICHTWRWTNQMVFGFIMKYIVSASYLYCIICVLYHICIVSYLYCIVLFCQYWYHIG